MRKIKSFSVRDMATLSREDMLKVCGGDFTVHDCKEGYEGKTCAVSFSGPTVTLGTCKYYTTTEADGFKYTFYCE